MRRLLSIALMMMIIVISGAPANDIKSDEYPPSSSATGVDEDYVQEQRAMPVQPNEFLDNFYLKPKFKEKAHSDVPFTFSNYKRGQQHQPFVNGPPATYYSTQQHAKSRYPFGQQQSAPPSDRSSYTHEIAIKQGRVKGIVRVMYPQSGLLDVNQYLGLPYAEAPVGNKRFMPPGNNLYPF